MQRFAADRHVRLAKMQHIFLTRADWESSGGILGLLLTRALSNKNVVTVHGPPNTKRLIAASRMYGYPKMMHFDVDEVRPESLDLLAPVFQDEHFSISACLLLPDRSNGDGNDRLRRMRDLDTDAVGPTPSQLIQWLQGHEQDIGAYVTDATLGKPFQCSAAYIVRGPPTLGKFDAKRARELGVTPGPMFGQLQRGNAVTVVSTGATVTPDQVMGNGRPGQVMGILDFSTPELVAAAIQHPSLITTLASSSSSDEEALPPVVFHLLGAGVCEHPTWKALVRDARWPASTRHIAVGPEFANETVTLAASATAHKMLAAAAPHCFLPYQKGTDASSHQGSLPGDNVVVGAMLDEFVVSPAYQHISAPPTVEPADAAAAAIAQDPFLVDAVAAATAAAATTTSSNLDDGDMTDWIVVALGTGSAVPSKYRNVSSTLVSTPNGPILLDCGEGTLGQLSRMFPETAGGVTSSSPSSSVLAQRYPTLQSLLDSLKLIFVSHVHADHQLGLMRFLHRTTGPLVVVAPKLMGPYLAELDAIEPFGWGSRVLMVDCDAVAPMAWMECFQPNGWHFDAIAAKHDSMTPTTAVIPPPPAVLARVMAEMQLTMLGTMPMIHRSYSYAVRLDGAGPAGLPVSVVFSGDTRPTGMLPALALAHGSAGPDLVVHEASFAAGMEHEAEKRQHSTVAEAIGAARACRAKTVLLTHFSQRYPKSMTTDGDHDASVEDDLQVAVAMDLMRINVSRPAAAVQCAPLIEHVWAALGADGAEEGEELVP
ncbi:beta-lactamase-like protein, partial [Blastocladiella britannica]